MDFILFINVDFPAQSNRTNRLLASSFNIPKYMYALGILTWVLIRVHKTGSHRIRSSHQVCFKSKIPETHFQKFYLGLNHGAKQARNTRGVTGLH